MPAQSGPWMWQRKDQIGRQMIENFRMIVGPSTEESAADGV